MPDTFIDIISFILHKILGDGYYDLPVYSCGNRGLAVVKSFCQRQPASMSGPRLMMFYFLLPITPGDKKLEYEK